MFFLSLLESIAADQDVQRERDRKEAVPAAVSD